MALLEIKNLGVEIAGKRVINGLDLEIPEGETHVLFGPNGSGKTSLMMSIMGFRCCLPVSGHIRFNGTDITNLSTDERARLGIGISFQSPPVIRGVKLGDVVARLGENEQDILETARKVNLPLEFMRRDINLGFSGGEVKRSELFQLLAQRPKLAMFDEPDSGVDVENLSVVGKAMEEFLKGRTGLIVTHQGHILRYVKADVAHVMFYGRIACSGEPDKIFDLILKQGYRWCEKCPKVKEIERGA
ncbi:MAG: ABC transporter ATP-binding protein [Candidatus Hadarchaeales archaeon]